MDSSYMLQPILSLILPITLNPSIICMLHPSIICLLQPNLSIILHISCLLSVCCTLNFPFMLRPSILPIMLHPILSLIFPICCVYSFYLCCIQFIHYISLQCCIHLLSVCCTLNSPLCCVQYCHWFVLMFYPFLFCVASNLIITFSLLSKCCSNTPYCHWFSLNVALIHSSCMLQPIFSLYVASIYCLLCCTQYCHWFSLYVASIHSFNYAAFNILSIYSVQSVW